MSTPLDRRRFLLDSMKYAGGALAIPSLAGLAACNDPASLAPGAEPRLQRATRGKGGYGPLVPDPGGLPYLIPAGFTLRAISRAGQPMKRAGAGVVPNAFDGMGAFPLPNGNVRLVRNHELRDGVANTVPIGARPWDAKAGAGCTSLEVAVHPTTGEPTVVDEFVSLSGTQVNCAGGVTPWGSWITCEETTEGIAAGREKNHGYAFEVPASATSEITPVPLRAMGRFVREAVVVDRIHGHVYQTEDDGNTSGFYRFIPNVPGDLARGGRVQMLAVQGRPQLSTNSGIPPLVPLPAIWVDIDDPDPATLTASTRLFAQGRARGGASFARLEGAWWGDDSCYFDATTGGAAGAGQVWQYRPLSANAGQLTLVFESPNRSVLDSPDNICVSPRGGIVICEDGGGQQFLRGLTPQGLIFDLFATSSGIDTEFAGACFSPDGRILFFNQQGSTSRLGAEQGATFAMWGPWEQGAL
jgi:uncharacterized protein